MHRDELEVILDLRDEEVFKTEGCCPIMAKNWTVIGSIIADVPT